MGRLTLEKKYTERRFNFRAGLAEIKVMYESIRDSEIFTEIEQMRLDTIYYKIQEAQTHLIKEAKKNGTYIYRGENGKTTIPPTEEEEWMLEIN